LIGRSIAGVLALAWLGGQGGLPDPIRHMLTARFPGWAFATLSPGHEASSVSGASPAWIAGDFDGDGRTDYAVQLVTPSSGGSVQRVLAFMRRGSGYTLVPLDSFQPTPTVYLQLVSKGAVRANLDAGARTFRLTHEAVDIVYDDQASKTCWYAAPRFQCALTGD